MKTPALESLFNKVADLRTSNVIKKRCFLVNIAKSLRTSSLKVIFKGLLLPLELFCKDFANTRYENASFGIREDSIWVQVIYFLITIAFWIWKCFYRIDRTTSACQLNILLCVAFIA